MKKSISHDSWRFSAMDAERYGPSAFGNMFRMARSVVRNTSCVMGSSIAPLESTADIEVTYRRDEKIGMWLPARMAEEYQGAIPQINNAPILGVAHSNATYSDYRRFGTSSTVIGVKK